MSPTRMSEENNFQSNRPYTLFYYPSSRLPPRMMSEDQVNEFWCLIDDEKIPFSVPASLSWTVNELMKTIRQERLRLQAIEIIDLVLWKLNDPIPVPDDDDDNTLPQLLSKPISSFSVKLSNRTQKLSDALPCLPQNHLHIIVKLPDQALERSAKRVKLEHESDKSLDKFRHFRDYYWGEDRIKHQTEGGKGYSILDLTPTNANLSQLNYRSIKILIVRDEYTSAYLAIVNAISELEPDDRVVFVFTGQPGIGKTLFLLILLVLRLQQKEPVALQTNSHEFVLFNEGGVTKHGEHDDFEIPQGAWTLSDSESRGPCNAFRFSNGHLIYTSSPASGRWMEWAKQFGGRDYVMDVWSQAEFRTLLTVSKIDITAGERLFLKYGSNIRRIMDILKLPTVEAVYIQDVERGAAEIAQGFSTIFQNLERLDFKSKLSSKIFTVRPNNLDQRLGVLTIPTAYLFKMLAAAVFRHALANQHIIFATLSAHPSLGTAAGWWFENYAHVRLSDPTRPPIQTHIRGVSTPPSIPAPKAVLAGSTALRKIQPPFDFYWRPREPNFEGIDGLIRVGNTVRVQQYTTSSSHRSAMKGLEEIRKIMNHIGDIDWAFDIVGPDLSVAESARDSHKLTGRWVNTPIYASELQIGILDKQMLERILNEATDDTYPEYRVDSMTGFQISSSSAPVHALSVSTLGHEEMGSTGAP